MRIGLGPVFTFEWLRTARNWRVYATRLLFGLGLLAVLAMVAQANEASRQYQTQSEIRRQAEAGRSFSMAIVVTQLALLLMVAPAATAGSICLDKQRGAMAHLMATDLADSEIVLGKLAARLLPPIGLVLASLGVTAICTLMGGVDPVGLFGAFLVSLGVTVFAASLALFLSVWAGKTHEVVMASYVVLLFWMLSYPLWFALAYSGTRITKPPDWFGLANPFVLVSDVRPGAVPLHHHAFFLLGCLGASAILMVIATLRIRPVAVAQMNRPARPKRTWWRRKPRPGAAPIAARRHFRAWPSPSLDGNPVLWREWQRKRPSRWSRAIWMIYAACSIVGTSFAMYIARNTPYGRGQHEISLVLVNGLQIAIGLLLLSVSAATALAEERVRGSLDVLMATPLPTRKIVMGKWWGAFRPVPSLAILPTVLAAFAAYYHEEPAGVSSVILESPWFPRWVGAVAIFALVLAYGAALTSFGLAMATWISRLERAVATTVAAYVFVAVGWMFLVMMLLNESTAGIGVGSASPFLGPAYTSAMIDTPAQNLDMRQGWEPQLAWCLFWVLAYATASAVLLKLTLGTFDRKLGRTPEGGLRRKRAPALPKEQEANVLVTA